MCAISPNHSISTCYTFFVCLKLLQLVSICIHTYLPLIFTMKTFIGSNCANDTSVTLHKCTIILTYCGYNVENTVRKLPHAQYFHIWPVAASKLCILWNAILSRRFCRSRMNSVPKSLVYWLMDVNNYTYDHRLVNNIV